MIIIPITSECPWQHCKEIPAINNAGNIADFNEANATEPFNFKTKITGQANDDGIINVEIMVSLKYLSNFWRTLEMPLINCEVELILNWSANCVIIYKDVEVKTYKQYKILYSKCRSKRLQCND